jgi:antibiotic biosynthesis monooxygenase (ABM) superfamily enzyme
VNEQTRARARRRLAMLLMTLAAWPVAFVVVLALLTLFGDELKSLPIALRALVISGVLVSLMANLVMPALNAAIGRWLGSGPATPPPRQQRSASVAARVTGEFETQGRSTGGRG